MSIRRRGRGRGGGGGERGGGGGEGERGVEEVPVPGGPYMRTPFGC